MYRSKGLTAAFCFTLAVLVVSPSIVSAHAITAYVPNVIPGQFAQYKALEDRCQSTIPQVCKALKLDLNDTTYAAIRVVGVSGTAITLQLISIYKNGTGAQQGALVDVATGSSNVTAFGQLSGDYFVLATGLHNGDQLWSNPSPTFNTTSTETVLGSMRSVNFLNSSQSGSTMGTTYSESSGFAYDQSSGFLIEIKLSITVVTSGVTTMLEFDIGMVDNNIWLTSHLPDFDLSANPTSINTPGTSTITLHRMYGFTATVALSATPSPSGITCSLSSTSLQMGGSDTSTLSCTGSPGTYTVIIEGNGGYTSHSAPVTVIVASNANPDFTISHSGSISFQAGSSGTATITITAQNGYSSATSLEVSSAPPGLTCSLSNNSVSGYGSVTLTCSGQPGSYTVTVKATGGGTSHSTQTTVTVSAASPTQPASSLPPVVYGGIGVAVVIAALVALLFLRRKPSGATVAPSNAPAPATQP